MAPPKIHLDADISFKRLQSELQKRGHDITRTPNEWIAEDAPDEVQLIEATKRERVLVTSNIKDFAVLTAMYPNHAGVIYAHQQQWHLAKLIGSLDKVFIETTADFWQGQVRWLNDWS